MKREKAFRSTASACPAGTDVASAAAISRESIRRISSFRRPTAFSREDDRSELLQTSSAKCGDLWAGEKRSGFISRRMTRYPRRRSCQAASQPASPAPMMVTGAFCVVLFT
jgi:hypothetical protein